MAEDIRLKELEQKVLVETASLTKFSFRIPLINRWRVYRHLGEEGVCTLKEAQEYLDSLTGLHEHSAVPFAELVSRKTTRKGAMIYTLKMNAHPDSPNARRGKYASEFDHYKLTPVEFKKPEVQK